MAIVSGGGRLNPWAEPFVPSGVRYRGLQTPAPAEQQHGEVEDFSPEWWRLVAASPAFRDRWLRDYDALGLLDGDNAAEVDSFLPEDLVSPSPPRHEGGRDEDAAGKTSSGNLEVAAWGIDKWWRTHGSPPEIPRYAEKAPRKIAGGARVNPRPIQQPR
ncbi:hypothetical protein EJB05_34984 [Eragrostis curvula]|uniref:Ataxin-2 C-terminal domain-containing protein n=1 Tax=Eragrostis curvula TaxID=38414 RepID=A0A5J9U5W6_9POAL|nr:hypothetical protein EJB05_34984 [Eragrostis curvula]